MISGRGLGHTGGTLDKMDAIPGYVSQPDNALFRKTVLAAGCAIIGQTSALAPPTSGFTPSATSRRRSRSVPLITASILSKKLAAGLQSLVLDVKVGNGAFMAKSRDATELATSLVEVANGAGTRTSALITGMNEPLASAAGNAVEVINAVDFLSGRRRDKRLFEVTMALAAEMLIAAGIAGSNKEGLLARHGRAGKRPRRRGLRPDGRHPRRRRPTSWSGPSPICPRRRSSMPSRPRRTATSAPFPPATSASPWWRWAAAAPPPDDVIDHAVGITGLLPVGAEAVKGEPLAIIHARSRNAAEKAERELRAAYSIGSSKPAAEKAIVRRIAAARLGRLRLRRPPAAAAP